MSERSTAEGGGLREQVYRDPRPPESMAPAHEWARTHGPGWTYNVARIVMTPPALGLYRLRCRNPNNVPARGPVLLAPNHFSNFDHFFVGVPIRRKVRFMGKSQLFAANPVMDYIFRVSGHFPVRRGEGDDEAFITANSILDRGGCVAIYAEGGRSRSGGLGEPRRGIGRLALESGAQVVPVAIQGSGDVRGWKRGRFPKVVVRYGEPLAFERDAEPGREAQQGAAERIFDRVRALYAETG